MNRDDKGMALIAVLIMMGVLSVIASSLIFVSQSETWSSQNYRLMSEARYGAESAVHRAANHLLYSYVPPDTAAMASGAYDRTVTPVRRNGAQVQLGTAGATNCVSNYAVSADVVQFQNAAAGALPGEHQVTYDACAVLTSMRELAVFPAGTMATIQTWRIIGEASIGGGRPARTEVAAVLERQVTPTFKYAAFASHDECDALVWTGGGTTDSYDSSTYAGGAFDNFGANIGTNGSLTESGASTQIAGSLATPRTGVGNCSTGSVTAWDLNGQGKLLGGVQELPQEVTYPTPVVPGPQVGTLGDFDVPKNGAGNYVNLPADVAPAVGPRTYGDVDVNGTLHLSSGEPYYFNTLDLSSGGTLRVDPGPVVIYITDTDPGIIPLDLRGGAMTFTGGNYDPSMLQIIYAGTAKLRLTGNATGMGLIYAPNATVDMGGNGDFYGSVIAKFVDNSGGAKLHYDRRLGQRPMMLGAWMIDSFSWNRF